PRASRTTRTTRRPQRSRPPAEDVGLRLPTILLQLRMRAKADLALPREGEVKRLDEPPEGGRINRPPWAMLLLSSTALHCGRAAPTELRHCGGGGHFGAEPMRRVPPLFFPVAQSRASGPRRPGRVCSAG